MVQPGLAPGACDWIFDLGPKCGARGGHIAAEGGFTRGGLYGKCRKIDDKGTLLVKALAPLRHPLIEWGVLLILLSCIYLRGIDQVDFHRDESHWIGTSAFLEAALDPHFTPPEWITTHQLSPGFIRWLPSRVRAGLGSMEPPNDTWGTHYWTLTQPPVARYIIAIGRRSCGYTVKELNTPWKFKISDSENRAGGSMPARGLLRSARVTMAVMSIASGMILFALVSSCAGRTAGWIFVVLYAGSPYLLIHLRRAMGDSPLLFFTCLAMLTGVLALQTWEMTQKRAWPLFWLAMMGFCAGLAGASKLNGLGLAGAGLALGWLIALHRRGFATRSERLTFAVAASLVVMLTTAITFIAVNPFLYPNPLARTTAMLLLRTSEMGNHQTNPLWGMSGLGQRLAIIPRRIFEDHALIHFGLMNALLGSVGMVYLVRSAWHWLIGKGGSPASPVLFMVGCASVFPALTTPLDWDRYYLFPVVFLSLLIAIGLGRSLTELIRKLRPESPPS